MHIIKCENCSNDYASRYPTTKFCSDKCRGAFNKRRLIIKACKRCNKPFEGNARRSYCSSECKKKPIEYKKTKELKPEQEKNCLCCGSFFMTSIQNKVHCSKECAYKMQLKRMHEERERNKTFHQKRCKECGKHFETTRSKACYCSEECSNKFENRRKETIRRNRMMQNGKVDWNISIERLVKRDKSVCYLCNEHVNKNAESNADDYPSIEHVIPIAKGGTHTWNNVKLAHRKCNYLKSDKILYTPGV